MDGAEAEVTRVEGVEGGHRFRSRRVARGRARGEAGEEGGPVAPVAGQPRRAERPSDHTPVIAEFHRE